MGRLEDGRLDVLKSPRLYVVGFDAVSLVYSAQDGQPKPPKTAGIAN